MLITRRKVNEKKTGIGCIRSNYGILCIGRMRREFRRDTDRGNGKD